LKIFIDENIPQITVDELKKMGHDIRDIRGTEYEGVIDTDLWKMAQKENRLLITTDKGFAQYRDSLHYGVLIICLRQPNRHKIHKRIILALKKFSKSNWKGKIVIMRDKTMHVSSVK